MISWQFLDSINGVQKIISDSQHTPQLILKHSTTCSISSIAKRRLEDGWSISGIQPHLLDLLAHRDVSNYIAETLDVYHESPQVIILHDGEAIHDMSHLDITIDEIQEVLDYHKL